LLNVTRDVPEVETVEPEKLARMAKALQPAPQEAAEEIAEDPGVLVGPRVPDWSGKSVKTVLRESMARGLPVEIVGSGLARTQWPAAGRVLGAGERVRVQFAR
jgi:hypothetical protein